MPIDEDLSRYTAPPNDTYDKDPNEYQAAHILHYIYKSIPDHNRDYDLKEVIEILQYAIGYIEDEEIGIDNL
jgi:hypothetical protein